MSLSSHSERPSEGWAQQSLRRHLIVALAAAVFLVGGVGGWAYSQQVASAVIAPGTVVVEGDVKKIQHFTGGNVSEIRIKEGEHVAAGQVLFVLDGTKARASLGMVEKLLAQLYMKRVRWLAEGRGEATLAIPADAAGLPGMDDFLKMERDLLTSRKGSLAAMIGQLNSRRMQLDDAISGYDVQIAASEDAISAVKQELATQEKLVEQRIVSPQRMLQLTREKAGFESDRAQYVAARASSITQKGELSQQLTNVIETRQTEISDGLAEVQAKILENEEKRSSAKDELDRLEIVSPVDGRALELTVHTKNGIITPGQELVLIVPDNQKLGVEAKIQTRDIDQMYVGQAVRVRFTAFNQRTTPEIDGVVANIAADAVTDPVSHVAYYPVRIEPKAEALSKLGVLTLYPGMPAEVFAHIAERTVISYLLKPLADQIEHTFREE